MLSCGDIGMLSPAVRLEDSIVMVVVSSHSGIPEQSKVVSFVSQESIKSQSPVFSVGVTPVFLAFDLYCTP